MTMGGKAAAAAMPRGARVRAGLARLLAAGLVAGVLALAPIAPAVSGAGAAGSASAGAPAPAPGAFAAAAWAAPAKGADQEEAPYWVSVTYQGDGSAEASARVEPYDNHTVHWKADPGAEVVSVQVDGQDRPDLVADGQAGHVDFSGITADHSVDIRFSAADPAATGILYAIDTAIEGGPGWITGAGMVPKGGSRVVSWEAEEGWSVAAVIVDGTARNDLIGAGSTIFQRMGGNHSVTVVVSPDEAAAAAPGADAEGDAREATLFAQRKAVSPTSPFPEPEGGAPRLVYDLVSAVHGGGIVSLVVGVVAFAALMAGAHVISDRRRYYEEDRQEAEEAAAAERAEKEAEADAYLAGYYDACLAARGEDAPDDDPAR